MQSIPFKACTLSANEALKISAASKQLKDLMSRLSDGTKYRVLTSEDRRLLKSEGYAPDLVNNIVFITQRQPSNGLGNSTFQDQLVTGFTFAAFDPSIYSTQSIKNNLMTLNGGRCCFCESELSNTHSSFVYHFRPPSVIETQSMLTQSPYYDLAYEQSNLVMSCHGCSEVYKGIKFNVIGTQYPKVDINNEKSVLVNPYFEDPRQYIRFNPLNGEAFPFDLVSLYFNESPTLESSDVESALWSNPKLIPLQYDQTEKLVSDPQNDLAFTTWLSGKTSIVSRGKETIAQLQLNRPGLLQSRRIQLNNSYSLFMSQNVENDLTKDVNLAKFLKLPSLKNQYGSMLTDAVNSWVALRASNKKPSSNSATKNNDSKRGDSSSAKTKKTKVNPQNTDEMTIDFNTLYSGLVSNYTLQMDPKLIPSWIKSALKYIVFESELSLEGKRRIIYLNDNDKLYGGGISEKCVFLDIDWENDVSNVIKVRTERHTWETSFVELSESRPLEIIELFSNSELWAEGHYEPLT